ncbi:MAG: recombinase family protein [Paracoccus sp. (in: a-proteobacteria)]|nr:recombinase family protein [Paracoccus sp. (in: a-proteobacteria)]
MRAALYARFSADLQNDRSVDDQLVLCTEYAARNGYQITARYSDRARSGATIHGRDGLLDLLSDARAGQFDLVLTESLDRLSRDQADLATIHKRLTFAGIGIIAIHEGRADAIQVGIRGLMSTLFLDDLKHKIRRRMTGVVSDGRVAGGNAYGYTPVPGQPGQPRINDEQAAIVRRIFAEYAGGRSLRDIARGLNDDSIPSLRGTRWNASTINGNAARGHGILTNPIYSGQIIWNRVTMVRDPDTGRRISRPNPETMWRRSDAEHLRIVDQELWDQVQARKQGRSVEKTPRARPGPAGRRLLSGLLRCARCGGGLSQHDRRGDAIRVTCATAKESGSCDNRRRYRLDKIERAVIDAVCARMGDTDAVAAWLDMTQAESRDTAQRRRRAEKALREAQGRLERLQMNLIDGRIDASFFDRQVGAIRDDIATRTAALDETPAANVIQLHPASLAEMNRVLTTLAKHLPQIDPTSPADRPMAEAFRSLIQHITIHDREGGAVACEIMGTIAPLIMGGIGGIWW